MQFAVLQNYLIVSENVWRSMEVLYWMPAQRVAHYRSLLLHFLWEPFKSILLSAGKSNQKVLASHTLGGLMLQLS